MRRPTRFLPFRPSPAWLLAIGLFVMALQALGGSGLMPRMAADGGFQVEICTSQGLGKFTLAPQSGENSQPAGGHQEGCTLCAASAPLLLADAALAVPPAPTFGRIRVASVLPRAASAPWLAHPPRGPPTA